MVSLNFGTLPCVLLIGNLGGNSGSPNGQTVRTRQIKWLLETSNWNVVAVDTSLRLQSLSLLLLTPFFRRIVVCPGVNAMGWLSIFVRLNRLVFRKRGARVLVAIGGWLPDLVRDDKKVASFAGCFSVVLAQSSRMVNELTVFGLNSEQLANFRPLDRISSREFNGPVRNLLFCSRVREDKGIFRAIEVCRELRASGIPVVLNVYGPLEGGISPELIDDIESGIRYCGVLSGSNNVLHVMAEHDVLIFPSVYKGEGIPGVLVEALFAGLPVLAIDFVDISEIVSCGETGYLFPVETFVERSVEMVASLKSGELQILSDNCLRKSTEYQPPQAAEIMNRSLR
jgi:glycosyltransferase involved in cell wall biosynthesis